MTAIPPPGPDREREWRLLLVCTRTRPAAHSQPEVRTHLSGQLDWDYLIATAHHHRVLPLLYRNLAHVEKSAIPPPAWQRLQTAFAANVRRNLFLTRELLRLLDLFTAENIRVIPYKGPVLASMLYGDPGLRQFADLDILVPVEDVSRAKAVLMSCAYRPEPEMSDRQLRAFIRRQKDITLLRDDLGIDVEMHWRITAAHDPVWIPTEYLWSHLRTHSFAGRSVLTLAPEPLLLILCIHGARHRWEKLAWLGDIAAIIRSPAPLDWNRLLADATSLDCERILGLGLSLVHDLLDTDLPVSARQLIEADTDLPPLAMEVKRQVFNNSSLAPTLGEPERFFLRLRRRRRDRLRIAFSQVRHYAAPTSRDEETVPLPVSLRWLLYVFRPVRLAYEYGAAPIRRFCRGLF
jgi:hypothetical protein